MYLKSLSLKGFKSFADRTVLHMEPGITAIVGPNGSGKSNISDAVLWVLGERNAKHLRGQAMEDVIFAGSSARRATSLAEVELVLDNSDHVLPVDFEEVVIARRMYRTGESEYLINGAVARRMDVLDILHDTGLGQGTHSIISQGSIDSILASKPEDRRALIEEAAGVLKHKQRLERSARKMERMRNHVDRITDVVNEVGRQLGPLERKAKRAKRYEELSVELSEVRLQLAVDDLRNLQGQHGKTVQLEESLSQELSQRKKAIDEADLQAQELQRRIREEAADAGSLSRQQRQAASSFERIESAIAVARDRKRAAIARMGEIDVSLERSRSEAETLEESLSKSRVELDAAANAEKAASEAAARMQDALDEANAGKDSLERQHVELVAKAAELERQLERAREDQALTQESLTSGLAHIQVLEGHFAELELQMKRCDSDARSAQKDADEIEKSMQSMEVQEREARELVAACSRAREAARQALDAATAQEQSIRTQIEALDALEKKRAEDAGEARKWASANSDSLGIGKRPLSYGIKAEAGYESLVEMLLGRDMSALSVADEAAAKNALEQMSESGVEGEMTFLLLSDSARHPRVDSGSLLPGMQLLVDRIECEAAYEPFIRALLGDVVLCENVEAALDAHTSDKLGLRFAVADGSVVWPSGKVSVGLEAGDEESGTLERIRHIDELKAALSEAADASAAAAIEASNADSALSDSQNQSLKASQRLAELRGNLQGAKSLAKQAADKLQACNRELEEAEQKKQEAEAVVANAKPDVERLEQSIRSLQEQLDQAKRNRSEVEERLVPARQKAELAQEQLAAATLEAAKAAEKKVYCELISNRHMEDIDRAKERAASMEATKVRKNMSAKRLDILLKALDLVAASSSKLVNRLEEEASKAQNSSTGLHAQVEELRKKSNEYHAAYDEASERLSEARIEKARIEMQVEAAVAEITEGCGASLETALAMPSLENRAEAEETRQVLDRRIAGLGTINPDAASEYDQLKERYDFLSMQLSDLSNASRALMKINRMIETRMKDDFEATFAQIDKNFQEVFEMLFPGGSAHLSLEDPEDMENTGVEVHAQPAGKRIAKMSLMSGGERSLTALALLFALYRTRPTPFYILDEVEAALDDTNLRRLTMFINAMRDSTQLVMITHQRRTMEMADTLFGVSMQADGVTKVISQKLDAALRNAE